MATTGSYFRRVAVPPEPLTRRQHQALTDILGRDVPELLPLAEEAINQRWLEDEEVERLTSALLKIFLAHLGPDDEPDAYGARADELVGLVEMQRRAYWQD